MFFADCTSVAGPSAASCPACTVPLQQVPTISPGCWSTPPSSRLLSECYTRSPCQGWGPTCTCFGTECSVAASNLDLLSKGVVPNSNFTLIGNTTLKSNVGLSMNSTDKIHVKGKLIVSGVLEVSNIVQSGTFLLAEVLPLESTDPTISGTFSNLVLRPQDPSCEATG